MNLHRAAEFAWKEREEEVIWIVYIMPPFLPFFSRFSDRVSFPSRIRTYASLTQPLRVILSSLNFYLRVSLRLPP
ncbi:hypothetical protein VFPBJ_03618 [Purpureocillium lilacinum]|uniref:Uncharacterized protein n=1 Tax=Purpureocillium lilacinum TaxID=33203 RepID=A0A179H5K0_PURLI|nr:hypothetical protein VFPBJ_03618 [Purpureocillium lilacinum]